MDLFAEIRFLSSNFKNFDSNIFTKRIPESSHFPAQRLIIFRLGLGLTQAQFATFLGTSSSAVHLYEAGWICRMQPETAEKFVKRIMSSHFNQLKLDLDTLLEKLSQFNATASGLNNKHLLIAGRKTWFTSEKGKEMAKRIPWEAKRRGGTTTAQLQKPTTQESEIIKAFLMEDLPFEFHPLVKGAHRNFVADFAIPDAKNPRIVIEARKFRSKNPTVIFQSIKEMALRAFRIKKTNPNIVTVGIIETVNLFHGEPLEILQEAFDVSMINENYVKIAKTLKVYLEN